MRCDNGDAILVLVVFKYKYKYKYIYIFIAFSLCVCACERDAKNTNSCEEVERNWVQLVKETNPSLVAFFFVFCFLEREIEMSLEEKRRGKEDHKNRKKILLHKKRKEEKG